LFSRALKNIFINLLFEFNQGIFLAEKIIFTNSASLKSKIFSSNFVKMISKISSGILYFPTLLNHNKIFAALSQVISGSIFSIILNNQFRVLFGILYESNLSNNHITQEKVFWFTFNFFF